MKVIKDVTALFQGAAGALNNNFYTGQALGVRIVPNTTGNLGNLWPRGIVIEDARQNQNVDLADSSWYVIQREILKNAYFGSIAGIDQSTDNPLSHTIGPAVKIRFNVDQVGASTSDNWDVYIAEDLVDVLTPLEPSGISFVRDAASGLYFPIAGASGLNGIINVDVTNQVTLTSQDSQIFDQTAAAGAAINTGTLGGTFVREILVRVSGLSAPTARTLTFNAVRTDASVVPITVSPAIGATVTDLEFAAGEAAILLSTPTGTTSLGFAHGGTLPISWNIVLSAGGADTPRMTIWQRQQS